MPQITTALAATVLLMAIIETSWYQSQAFPSTAEAPSSTAPTVVTAVSAAVSKKKVLKKKSTRYIEPIFLEMHEVGCKLHVAENQLACEVQCKNGENKTAIDILRKVRNETLIHLVRLFHKPIPANWTYHGQRALEGKH